MIMLADEFRETLSRARAGDTAAQGELFAWVDQLVKRATAHLQGERWLSETVSDLRQETLTRLIQALPQFRGETPEEFAAWVRAAVHSAKLDLARLEHTAKRGGGCAALSLDEVASDDSQSRARPLEPSDKSGSVSVHVGILQALAALTKEDRALLALRYDEGLTNQEIAARLACNEATIRRRLRRIHQTLESRVEPYE
jgi:RNA polymerase sigma factor (sigma-70 family)